jgi:thioredoxin
MAIQYKTSGKYLREWDGMNGPIIITAWDIVEEYATSLDIRKITNGKNMKELRYNNYYTEISNSRKKLVIVDFWASWCGPCKTFSSIFERLDKRFSNEIDCFKYNIEEGNIIPRELDITMIPTIIIYKGNKVIFKINGLPTEQMMITKIGELLK